MGRRPQSVMWLLCDYGEVLSTAQPAGDVSELAARTGLSEDDFCDRYWRHRPPYDRADVTVGEYWASVLGIEPSEPWPADVVPVDVRSWLHPNRESVAAVERAAARGFRLAVLSNAPLEVARGIDALPWMAAFERRFFSCYLRAVKPDPAAYHQVIEALGAVPEEIVFFDDREDNVMAAAALGIEAHMFMSPRQFDDLPAPSV